MNQFKKMEVFVCSEDACRSIGLVDETEVWSNGSELGHLILRGFNAGRDGLLQAENECLRKDVEFYKNRVFEVERELEMDEDDFEDLIIDAYHGARERSDVAEQLKITLVKHEATEVDKLAEDLAGIYGANLNWTAKVAISEALAERGWAKAPDA